MILTWTVTSFTEASSNHSQRKEEEEEEEEEEENGRHDFGRNPFRVLAIRL
jgi:hypothetical protein